MKKKFLSLLLALAMCLSFSVPVFAAQPEEIDPNNLGGSFYRKVVTNEYYEWSEYRRVSHDLKTGAEGGSITCSEIETFSVSFSGEVYGLSFNTEGTIESSDDYSLNVGPYQSVYMGFRARILVEEGIRQKVSVITNQVLSENTYVARIPQYGEYALLPA